MGTVRVDGLSARLGRRQVLDGVSLRMQPGVHGLLGPNGAGKTTLMRILATVRAPQAGTVRLCGYDTAKPAERTAARARLGYLPQSFGYYRGFTVAEFVEYLAWLKQVPPDRVPAAVARAIERVGLSERARSKMKTLSGGMLRRVGIAQALVNDPDVLLLDEPTAGLDPEQRVEFRKLLREIGLTGTVIVSTHLVEDVATACGQVTLLEAGRLAFTGGPDELADLAGPEGDDAAAGESALERGYAAALARARERVAA
jgi:ABC-2 type transport system ATP-binding protein